MLNIIEHTSKIPLDTIRFWQNELAEQGLGPGKDCTALRHDFSGRSSVTGLTSTITTTLKGLLGGWSPICMFRKQMDFKGKF